ncbi:MAG: hypothetical protein ACLPYZ_12190, partial [Limisphaerales bacterium]
AGSMTRAVLALMGVSFLWFMVLLFRTGIHPLAFLHTFPYTTSAGKSHVCSCVAASGSVTTLYCQAALQPFRENNKEP